MVQIEFEDDNKMWSDMWLRRREKESQEGRREESLGWVVLYLFFLSFGGAWALQRALDGPGPALPLFFGSDLPGGLLLEGRGGMNGAWRLGLGHLPVHVNENACSVLALH